ncbi:hypothetical protein N0V93_004999 [Gnomoniopsis smithogilvyi]|uniref:Heterokaryon incompatibility domain-containing protein n=1 Tax=Gnomoniopsis smithogilvyi TaxID=1191159 RepID=A0A9W9CWB5_9PEZI|nr:hypothetical protein N0V93_004999 [Gnomoniopsis smithogilvyi]
MSPAEGPVTTICTRCRDALCLPRQNSDSAGYTPVAKYDFLYTTSHTFEPHDSHDGTCGFYVFLLGVMQSNEVTAMVRDQIGLEEQVRSIQPPFVMYADLWFRDNFSDRDSEQETDEQPDECLLMGSLYFPLGPGLVERQWRGGYLCFPLTKPLGPYLSAPHLPLPLAGHALDPDQVSLMKDHLAKCEASCGYSSEDAMSTFLPERLVDVRGTQPRVVQSATLSRDAMTLTDLRYLTLSYCWGDGTQLKLTRGTAPALHTGFSLDATSGTQRDTIALARALDIPFVWIDALCIQQGDEDDWTRESSLMHKIYGHSYVTVCSLTSASCREGYLAREWPQVVVPSEGGCYMLRSWMCSPSLPDGRRLAEQCRVTSQWGRRAWTFQEEALSPRRIYFTRLGMHFSCIHPEDVCESSYPSLASGLTEMSLDTEGPQLDTVSHKSKEKYEAWYSEVVPSYSRRQVTNSADWLPALSGLAQRFAFTLHDNSVTHNKLDYVAGLWKSDLVSGLFWSWLRPPVHSLHLLLEALDGPFASPASYICPSWSWVGRGHIYGVWAGGGTGFIGRGPRPRPFNDLPGAWTVQPAYIGLDVQIQQASADPYGQISSASLRLATHAYDLFQCEHPSLLHEGGRRYVSHGPKSLVNPIHRFHLDEDTQCSIIFDWAVQSPEEDLGQLLLVLVGTLSATSRSYQRGEAFGLVVHPSRCAEGKYLRVGTFGYRDKVKGRPADEHILGWVSEEASDGIYMLEA